MEPMYICGLLLRAFLYNNNNNQYNIGKVKEVGKGVTGVVSGVELPLPLNPRINVSTALEGSGYAMYIF